MVGRNDFSVKTVIQSQQIWKDRDRETVFTCLYPNTVQTREGILDVYKLFLTCVFIL